MTSAAPRSKPAFAFPSPDAALAALLPELAPVPTETVPLASAPGRVLGQEVLTDRPSPACDVSAMDGYVVPRVATPPRTYAVAGEVLTGASPRELPADAALRIFTGGPVPTGAWAIIPRELTIEEPDRITLREGVTVEPGQYIRRRGENAPQGARILDSGRAINAAVMSALRAFGVTSALVHRRVRVAVIVTGDELITTGDDPQPWQVRDSNAPALRGMLEPLPWLDLGETAHVTDDRDRLREAIGTAIEQSDALFLTGGVSMGDHDHVAEALASIGAREIFHWLPIRPGKPLLAAVGPAGQAILGLPGNPVSVISTARRYGLAALARLAGIALPLQPTALVTVLDPDEKTLPLYWSRPVRLVGPGEVQLIATRGSGDLVSTAGSDGFVEVEPGRRADGPLPFYSWQL